MRYLLDTHTFLWFVDGDDRLGVNAKLQLMNATNERFLSVASVWEMAIKAQKGKLVFAMPFREYLHEAISAYAFTILNIELAHAESVFDLPSETHGDPFDRMLAVQSLQLNIPILSIDDKLDQYGVSRVW